MNYEEFQRQLGKAGLNMREFAELLKMNRNSISNYAKTGVVPAHLAVISALLGTMADNKIDFRPVLANLDIEEKKPRGGAAKGRFGGTRQADLFGDAT